MIISLTIREMQGTQWCLHELYIKPISYQFTEDGLVLEHGRSVQLNVEEEIKRGIGPAPTLLQHMVEMTVLVVLRNFKNVTRNPVQVGSKFALVTVHSLIKLRPEQQFLA